jgi:hypothetical protein
MGWLERTGFVVVALLLAGFVGSFFYEVDEWISAEGVEIQLNADKTGFVASASLSGKSVAKAAEGQKAEISNIRIASEGDTLLRAQLDGASRGEAISRRLAGESVRKALESSLVGRSVRAREDVPLKVTGIGEIEVEAGVRTSAAAGQGQSFDPDPDQTLTGHVVQGRHVLSAQLGDLPPDIRQAATLALERQLVGQSVEVQGRPQLVEAIHDPRFVVKLEAEGVGQGSDPLPGASLKRSFEATIELSKVPDDLAARMREAIRQGRKVTAKIQVRTGSRPIAYFLLRRS